MLLMIDNYDSFTFNLVQYFQQLGQKVQVHRHDQISIDEIAAIQPDHLVISPGPKSPQQAGISLQAIAHFAGTIPLLGICLGHQAIAAHYGANIVRASKPMHGKTSAIEHFQQGVFAGLSSPLTVARYHSLVVDPSSLPDCLELTAWHTTEQGERQIMGLRHKQFDVEGVQFHPEAILTQNGLEILDNFLSR